MMVAFFIAMMASFTVLVGLFIFYASHKQRLPYYRVDHQFCIQLLEHAVAGGLPLTQWDYFIGMSIQHSSQLESLRLLCVDIDERYVTGRHTVKDCVCVTFSTAGQQALLSLLDEWRHKVDCVM